MADIIEDTTSQTKKRDAKADDKLEEDKVADIAESNVEPSEVKTNEEIVSKPKIAKGSPYVINGDDKVLLVDNAGRKNLIKVRHSKKFKLSQTKGLESSKGKFLFISGDDIINRTYGTIVEIKNNKAIVKSNMHALNQEDHLLDIADMEITNDNRDINDISKNQKLWYEEIEFQKSKGVSGEELVEQIVKNSSTFNQRTQFSKEKYLKKLKKRHLNLIEFRYPSLFEVCEYAYDIQERRMINLRYDALAYILNCSNATFTSKVLVVENTKGLVTAGLVERMNGQGEIRYLALQGSLSPNLQSHMPYLYRMNNLGDESIKFTHFKELKKSKPNVDQLRADLKESFTSWVIVHDKYTCRDLFDLVYPFLKPSWYVVVHWEHLQPIAELEKFIRNSRLGVMIHLEDFWTREYQVLPMRTHPNMSMTNNSGYILTFITVDPGN